MLKTFFQSKLDPTQISLTISSFVKVLSALIATVAVMYGVDATPLIANIKLFADELLLAGTTLYTAYHTSQLIWGIARKFFVA